MKSFMRYNVCFRKVNINTFATCQRRNRIICKFIIKYFIITYTFLKLNGRPTDIYIYMWFYKSVDTCVSWQPEELQWFYFYFEASLDTWSIYQKYSELFIRIKLTLNGWNTHRPGVPDMFSMLWLILQTFSRYLWLNWKIWFETFRRTYPQYWK